MLSSTSTSQIKSILAVIIFQLSLCLLVHCSGVSIIWCAMGGWIISERKRLRKQSRDVELSRARDASIKFEYVVMLADVGAIIYYGVVADAISTVAHVCALILGAALSLMSIRMYDDPLEDDGVASATSATPLVTPK